MLCKVALGNMNEKLSADYDADNLPEGKNSIKGLGKTAPSIDSYIKHGSCMVPQGKGIATNIKW